MKIECEIRNLEDRKIAVRPVNLNDPWNGYTEDEKDEAMEFIAWYIQSEHEPILRLSGATKTESWFDWNDPESAFNTNDFEQTCGKFEVDKWRYKCSLLMEQIKELALMHSCLSNEDGRLNTHNRARIIVENEFLNPAIEHLKKSQRSHDWEQKAYHRHKYREFLNLVSEAAKVWKEHSAPSS